MKEIWISNPDLSGHYTLTPEAAKTHYENGSIKPDQWVWCWKSETWKAAKEVIGQLTETQEVPQVSPKLVETAIYSYEELQKRIANKARNRPPEE